MRLMKSGQHWCCWILTVGFVLFHRTGIRDVDALPSDEKSGDQTQQEVVNAPKPRRIITLAESIKSTMRSLEDPEVEEVRKQYWKKTLEDIEKLSFGMTDKQPLFSQWKQLLDQEDSDAVRKEEKAWTGLNNSAQVVDSEDTASPDVSETSRTSRIAARMPRFEGFPSWERMLQEWAEDVQEYIQQVESESGSEYMLANYGRPLGLNNSQTTQQQGELDDTAIEFPRINGGSEASGDYDVHKSRQTTQRVVPTPLEDGELALPHTDLSDKSKRIEIVTTASLPWKTGTAVNPLLRAAHMLEGRKENGGSVTLMLPWLERRGDQERVYGANNIFETPEDQEAYIRTWLRESANMPQASQDLRIRWYTAWQNKAENSLYSMGDLTALIPADEVDICILEEPEHLVSSKELYIFDRQREHTNVIVFNLFVRFKNWYRAPGESWTKKFPHVVGILHTNYFQYALDQPAAIIRAPAMRLLCSWMCRAHCHRIVKLSGTLDKVAPEKELVENVHGVRGTFLDVGSNVSQILIESSPEAQASVFSSDAEPTLYFIGKMLWSKGLGSLMELLKYFEETTGMEVKVDMYGGGPDKNAAEAKAKSLDLDMPFLGPLDHAELAYTHKIFVNPSTSEVLCTTSAEALAMGKFVIGKYINRVRASVGIFIICIKRIGLTFGL